MPSLIAAYLDDLDRALSFDPALASHVREEIESHLLETAEHCGEQDAIARFGQAVLIARSYATAGWANRLRRSWFAALGLLCATFLLMRLRTALLDLPGGADPLILLDRGGLTLGLFCIVLAGVLAARLRFVAIDARVQSLLHAGCAALILSVAASLLRALPMVDGGATFGLIVCSIFVELGLIALLLRRLGRLGRYAACIAG